MNDSCKATVDSVLAALGWNADNVRGAARRIEETLSGEFGPQTAHDMAFHLTDWHREAAFLMALLGRPDAFSAAEIRAGLQGFLIHAPNHIAAAAKLGGWPTADIFGVGALDGPPETPPEPCV